MIQPIAAAVLVAFLAGFGAGAGWQLKRWHEADIQEQAESYKTLQSAVDRANEVKRRLDEATVQIDAQYSEEHSKLDDALAVNRALYERLRDQNKSNRCAVSKRSRSTEKSDAGTAEAGPLPGGIQGLVAEIPPEFAAECDRVLAIARAGQEWAKRISEKK